MIDQALRTGAKFFLNKPFSDEELRLHLQSAIESLQGGQSGHTPLTWERMNALIKQMLGPVPFRLVEQVMTSEHLSSENLLALYSSARTTAFAAVAVLDLNTALMMHAGAKGMPPNEAKAIIDAGKLSNGTESQGSSLLKQMGDAITLHDDSLVKLVRESVVNQGFAKLQELILRNRGSSGFRVDIPGYGSGRIGVMLM